MTLADLLVTTAPLERSGSTAANRFDYQLTWALRLLLDLHKRGTDYVLVMDYHDDVLVLDSASDPKTVTCYQVKSKKPGNWSIRELTKREDGKKGPLPSIIGKLFRHTVTFSGAVAGLCFVSNASFAAKTTGGQSTKSLDSIAFAELSSADQATLKDAVCAEFGCTSADDLAKFMYERSTMSIEGHEHNALGAVAEFLASLPQTASIPSVPFYRTLKLELSKLMRAEGKLATFVELCSIKSTTRAAFEQMLARANAEPRPSDLTHEICLRLNTEGVAFVEVEVMRRELRRLSVERMTVTNIELRDALTAIAGRLHSSTTTDLWSTIEAVRDSLATTHSGLEPRFGLPQLRAMIGILLYEVPPLSSPNPGSSGAPI